ncbi:MAG: hypothetical protein JJU40_05510, partial [Rhodobacteraceae bacterium]|nr:hypothetical protein [Paracoccaceae bacterium]
AGAGRGTGAVRVAAGMALAAAAGLLVTLALLDLFPVALAVGVAAAATMGASGLVALGGALVLGAALAGLPGTLVALAGAGGAALLARSGQAGAARSGLVIYGIFALPLMAALAAPDIPVADHRALFLALTLLPLCGAVLVGLGWALSLALLRRSTEGRAGALRAMGWTMAALLAATVMALAKGAALVVLLATTSLVGGTGVIRADALLSALMADPAGHGWLIALVMLPVLPIVVHLLIVLTGVQGLWPLPVRHTVAARIETSPDSPGAALGAGLGLALLWALPLLAIAAGLWGLWSGLGPALHAMLGQYLAALEMIAARGAP